jgi:undecaprenyl-diphosphatase
VSVLQAALLGIVQGLTEFFPVSSSAHLILVPWIFGWHFFIDNPDLNKTFDVALHVGTFVAILGFMWRDVVRLLRAFFGSIWRRRIETADEKLAWLLLVSTIPAGLVGVAFESFIEEQLGKPYLIAILMIAFGAIMWAVDSRLPLKKKLDNMRWPQALFVGVAQALALAPGVSRSGVTLTALRGLKMDRRSAIRYAFLLTLPIIGGSAVYKSAQVIHHGGLPAGTGLPFLVGAVAAAVSGFFAAWFLFKYLRSHSLRLFVWYRFVAGVAVLIVIAVGLRGATGI